MEELKSHYVQLWRDDQERKVTKIRLYLILVNSTLLEGLTTSRKDTKNRKAPRSHCKYGIVQK